MRTSKKECNAMADAMGAMFYGKDEHKLNNKCYVRYNGKWHEFKTYTDALIWMIEESGK